MTNNDHTSIILHLPFHPNDPPSYKIQQALRDTVASPKYHMPLHVKGTLVTLPALVFA